MCVAATASGAGVSAHTFASRISVHVEHVESGEGGGAWRKVGRNGRDGNSAGVMEMSGSYAKQERSDNHGCTPSPSTHGSADGDPADYRGMHARAYQLRSGKHVMRSGGGERRA